ncbi:hypothetical protein ABZW30_43140 [Kitasatospora sp. NPDC004669]|uniref:hypothetical protein n=1 Tax=Kitasatospora sp. NPDC004669 TaxID=3154555 RepID=UPI0033BD62A2
MTTQHDGTSTSGDPGSLVLSYQHSHALLDGAAQDVQHWSVSVTARNGKQIGQLETSRCRPWDVANFAHRLADESPLLGEIAAALLTPDGQPNQRFEDRVERAVGDFLVIEGLDLAGPYDDPQVAAAVLASVTDRLGGDCGAIVIPRWTGPLLEEAGVLLGALEFSERLRLIDTALAVYENAAQRIREQLARHRLEDLDDDEEEYEDDWEMSARTAAVLRLALEELSQQAWEEVTALADEPLAPSAAGLFARLPPLTFRQSRSWRRQMARAFDDLAGDLAAGRTPLPTCTGEEMALHLAIRQARTLLRDRPNRVATAIEELPRSEGDFDWDACLELLFEDHDVLMLFDRGLDGFEEGELAEKLGTVNLSPGKWFEPFGEGRDPERGFRHD